MLKNLLIGGLIAGVCAGLIAFGVASLAGEPAVDSAIAFEESRATEAGAGEAALVSRDVQKSFGLVTAATVYGLALGGLFALVFAVVYGRVARDASPERTALWLAAIAFVVVFLVPFLKYPANPPAVGEPGTIESRTAYYFLMMWISVFAAVAAVRVRRAAWRVPTYLVLVAIAFVALPGAADVPDGFPAQTLWEFRQASVAVQLALWTTIGITFSLVARRAMEARR